MNQAKKVSEIRRYKDGEKYENDPKKIKMLIDRYKSIFSSKRNEKIDDDDLCNNR